MSGVERRGRGGLIAAGLLVMLLAGVMVALGVWQLHRAEEKTQLLAALRANAGRPAMSFPQTGPVTDDILFRASAFMCLRVTGWRMEAGRAADGSTGYRHIADCATGAEGQGAPVVIGISQRPDIRPDWRGGRVSGYITAEPDHRSVIARLFGPDVVSRPMLVSNTGLAGLAAPARPDPSGIPNNHMSYAVQWFAFAAVAVIIFLLAARRRLSGS